MLKKIALTLFISSSVSQNALSDFQHEIEGALAKASTESEQHHKDQDTDYYSGRYSYYLDPVEPYTALLGESAFFARSAFVSFEIDRSAQVPKDDFLSTEIKYDWGSAGANYRIRAGAIYVEHKAEQRTRYLTGGLLGVSVYLLDTARADIDSSYASGDGFEISESAVTFRQVYTAYDHDIVFKLGLAHDAYKSPYTRVGRRASGFTENSWNGKVGWYFLPTLQLGLGHRATSRDYRYTKDNSSKNKLLVYGESTPNIDLSLYFEGSLAREVIEIANADLNITDDTAAFNLGFKIRF